MISHLDLMLSNDSGLMHVAAGLGRPLVALFGSSDPARTGPRGDRQAVLTAHSDCEPCFKPVCPLKQPCLETISVEEVVQTAQDLIEVDTREKDVSKRSLEKT
jgi:heptosyltransferase-2